MRPLVRSSAVCAAFLFPTLLGCGPDPAAEPARGPISVHLFDLAPLRVEMTETPYPPAPAFAAEHVTVLEEPIRSKQFASRTAPFVERKAWYWSASTRFPIGGPARVVKRDAAADPLAGRPSGDTRPRPALDEAWIGPDGVWVAEAGPGRRPEGLTVSYRTPHPSLVAEMRSPLRADGLPLTRELTLGDVTRRASLVGSPSRLAWRVRVLPGARLHVRFGLNRFGFKVRPGGLQILNRPPAGCDFLVEVRPDAGEPETVFTQRIEPARAGRFEMAAVDLSEYAGREVELHFVTGDGTPSGGSASGFPFWSEPVLQIPREAPPPNVLLILIDTLRADRLGCYGWERAETPNLDALAGRGVLFSDASSAASWTLPAHASLFASAYPSEHGVWEPSQRLPDPFVTIAEVLRDHGYRTAAITDGGYVRARYGMAQGFDHFETVLDRIEEIVGLAEDWIEQAGEPWFAFVQTYQVHAPYDPPEEFRERLVRAYDGPLPAAVTPSDYPWGRKSTENTLGPDDERYLQDLYDAEIAYVDRELGKFLDRLRERGALDDTLVIVTSDHGEEFGDHGHFSHGISLYQEQLHVPLILYLPGHFEGGQLVSHPVHGVDLAPTIAVIAGATPPDSWSGVPFGVDAPEVARPMFHPGFVRQSGEPVLALRIGGRKYIDYPAGQRPSDPLDGPKLFDLREDGTERENLWSPEEDERWREAARDLLRKYVLRIEPESSTLSPDLQNELRALGYLGDE